MKNITWFDDSPDAGDPACLCSWCGKPIAEADAPVIRVFDEETGRELRLHYACSGPALGLNVGHVDMLDNQD